MVYVEDNPINAELMGAIMGLRPDIRLLIFGDGASGLAGALENPPALFLLDLNLPDVDGISLLEDMRKHEALQDAPAILVSAGATPADIDRAKASGFACYWMKPINVEDVLAELDQRLGPPAAPLRQRSPTRPGSID